MATLSDSNHSNPNNIMKHIASQVVLLSVLSSAHLHAAETEFYLLDSVTVNAIPAQTTPEPPRTPTRPSAVVTLATKDYASKGTDDVQKTREDWPFDVNYSVSGFSTVVGATIAETHAHVKRRAEYYEVDSQNQVIATDLVVLYDGYPRLVNTSPGLEAGLTSGLILGSPTKFASREYFSVSTIAEENPLSHAAVIDSKKLDVWPKPQASLSFVNSTDSFGASTQELKISVSNRFPGSLTFVQVYPGSELPDAGLRGEVIASSSFNTQSTQAFVLEEKLISDWYSYIKTNGAWIIELISVTRLKDDANFNLVPKAGSTLVGGQIMNIQAGNSAGLDPGTYLIEKASGLQVTGNKLPQNIVIRASITTDQ
jgi:hypothetical protein